MSNFNYIGERPWLNSISNVEAVSSRFVYLALKLVCNLGTRPQNVSTKSADGEMPCKSGSSTFRDAG